MSRDAASRPFPWKGLVLAAGLALAPIAAQAQQAGQSPSGQPRPLREAATSARQAVAAKPTIKPATVTPASRPVAKEPKLAPVERASGREETSSQGSVRPVQHTESSARRPQADFDYVAQTPNKKPSATNPVTDAFQRAGNSFQNAFRGTTEGKADDDPVSLSNMPTGVGVNVYLTSARVMENKNNPAGAERQYRAALEKYPTNRQALISYGRLLHREGRLPESVEIYRQAAQSHSDDPVVYNDMGLCLAKMGQTDEALASIYKAIKLAPKNIRYRNNMASILADQGRLDEAYSQLEYAHGPAAAHYNLGYLQYRRGDQQGAVHYWKEALKIDSQFEPARQMLDALGEAAPRGQSQPKSNPDEMGPSLIFRGPAQAAETSPGTVFISDGRNEAAGQVPGRRLPPVPDDGPQLLPPVR